MNSNKLTKHNISKLKFTMISNTKNPYKLFENWFSDAKEAEINNYNAMNVATIGDDNRPTSRMVLLKDYNETGFVFYTNQLSRKGQNIAHTPYAALCFHWKSLDRQVRIEGRFETVSDTEADDYFASRARGSQIAAWASKQSTPLASRKDFDARIEKYELKFPQGMHVPRPPHWSGYRLNADRLEFWQEMPYRRHDRVVYTLNSKGEWETHRLYP